MTHPLQHELAFSPAVLSDALIAGDCVKTTRKDLTGEYVIERINDDILPWPIAFLDGGPKGSWCRVSYLQRVQKHE